MRSRAPAGLHPCRQGGARLRAGCGRHASSSRAAAIAARTPCRRTPQTLPRPAAAPSSSTRAAPRPRRPPPRCRTWARAASSPACGGSARAPRPAQLQPVQTRRAGGVSVCSKGRRRRDAGMQVRRPRHRPPGVRRLRRPPARGARASQATASQEQDTWDTASRDARARCAPRRAGPGAHLSRAQLSCWQVNCTTTTGSFSRNFRSTSSTSLTSRMVGSRNTPCAQGSQGIGYRV